jgi:hypothetical protein
MSKTLGAKCGAKTVLAGRNNWYSRQDGVGTQARQTMTTVSFYPVGGVAAVAAPPPVDIAFRGRSCCP